MPVAVFPTPTADEKVQVVSVRRDLVDVAGDFVVGGLLSQIVWWHQPSKNGATKLRVKRDNVWWIAKTREEWMAETGLTVEQYKRAISVLKAKGLIELRLMKFGDRTISHIRLIPEALQTALGGKPSIRLASLPPTGRRVTPQPITQRLPTEITNIALAQSAIAEAADERQDDQRQGMTIEEVICPEEVRSHPPDEERERGCMKVEDILKQKQTQPVIKASLGAYWNKRMATVYGGSQKPVTGKERGQLAQLRKYVGPDQVYEVIDYAINYWAKFAALAGVQYNVSFPATPVIGFLLKYYPVAVNLLQPVAPPAEVSVAPVSISSNVIKIPSADVKQATQAELEKLLADLD